MLCRLSMLSIVAGVLFPAIVCADTFDNYTNTILAKIPEAKSVQKITKLTPQLMIEHSRALPGITAAFIVVKTNEGRFARLLVRPAGQKIGTDESVPFILVERYVTYRDGEERAILESGQKLHLFGGFRFSLDLGQVVPGIVPADLHAVAEKDSLCLVPVDKAELYLVTKHLPEANPPKQPKLVVGAQFETRYFNGIYQLHDDGRRAGKLHLKVADNGDVTGSYYSDKDGQKYEVGGKVSNSPRHMINFFITYPRTTQTFTGYLFTGDGRAITGWSRLQSHDTGFYAERIEDTK